MQAAQMTTSNWKALPITVAETKARHWHHDVTAKPTIHNATDWFRNRSERQHNVDQFEIDAELIALSTKIPVMSLSMPNFMNAM